MVESGISVLCEQCLADRIPDEDTLRREMVGWETVRNEQHRTVNWHFTTSMLAASSSVSVQSYQNHLEEILDGGQAFHEVCPVRRSSPCPYLDVAKG